MYWSKSIIAFVFTFIILESCQRPRCNDGILNGDEIEIDCGGDCPNCFSCNDGILNQDEYAIDCGGVCSCNEAEALNTNGLWGIIDLSFPNQQNGFLLGQNRVILKTTDGSNNYEELFLPQLQFDHGSFDQIEFITSSTGLVIERPDNVLNTSAIYITQDGGANWNVTIFDEIIQDYVILDEQNFIVSTLFYKAQSENLHSGAIYKSSNAGLDWEKTFDADDIYGNGQVKVGIHNLEQRDAHIIAIAGHQVLESYDNGLEWQIVGTNDIILEKQSLQFRNEKCFGLSTEFSNENMLYYSDDILNWEEGNVNTKIPDHISRDFEFHPAELISKGDQAFFIQNDHEEYSRVFRYEPELDSWESYGGFHPDLFYSGSYSLSMSLSNEFLFIGMDLDILGRLKLDN